MSKPRKSLFNPHVPVVRKQNSDLEIRPDLFVMILNGRLQTSRLNEKADLKAIINIVDDLLYELRLRRRELHRR